jgi:hypothetical protein
MSDELSNTLQLLLLEIEVIQNRLNLLRETAQTALWLSTPNNPVFPEPDPDKDKV